MKHSRGILSPNILKYRIFNKHILATSALATFCLVLTACGDGNETITDNDSGNSSSGTLSCQAQAQPSSPLRRLTRFEYDRSVKDLLGVDTAAVKDMPADVSDGFDNNAALQVAPELLVEKYVLVSEALAAEAVKDVSALTSCNASSRGEVNCAESFADSFGRRAFRRPLSNDDKAMFMAAYRAGADGGSHAEGIEVMVRMALQSPNFLYRLELSAAASTSDDLVALNDFELATRLSYFLWGTGPDDALLDLAAAGQLSSKAQVSAKAREMLASDKSRQSVNNFLAQWSGVRKLETLTRNTTLFPNYSNTVRDAMMQELPAFVDHMLSNQQLNLETLFTSNQAFVSQSLAGVYGVSTPPGASINSPALVNLPTNQGRAGLLTQAGFLAVQGHPDQTSPVLRGKFVRAKLLCDPPPPPPDDVDISVPDITEGATARDRASVHLSVGGGCAACHTLMDPIGLAFENFDAMGQFQTIENGHDIDVSGEMLFVNDPVLEGAFTGVKELAGKLAQSKLVEDCVSTQMFRFASGRYEHEGDSCSISSIQEAFTAADGDIVELMIAMTQTDAFLYRTREAK